MSVIDLKNATIKIKDGTGTPNELEINIGEGQMKFTEKRNIEYRRNRGVLDDVVEGDEEPMEVSLDFQWEFLKASSGDPPTIEDALKQRGGASAWISSDTDTCRPYAVDIEILYTPPCGSLEDETITLEDFRWESLDHDLKGASVSVTGKCNRTEATVVRS